MKRMKRNRGKVYLVGAGPGDPGLLTLKAKALLEDAQVVIYDYLANPAFLDYADNEAELIYVGKKGGCHTLSQSDINKLIIERARKGLRVVRLKGGDPFIFGRGGEEAQELIKAGLSFEVVPGVTSAIAAPAYAGIPLTHRNYTSTVAFITGHEDPEKEETEIAWDKVATAVGTLVFLMGVGNLEKISRNLINQGRSGDTPAAVVRRGTVAEQRTIVAPLKDIAKIAREESIRPPAIIVVGDVVNLRDELNWFEMRPLFGRRIVVTRAREQASAFLKALAEQGAECIEFPTIEVAPPQDWAPLDRAVRSLESYQWMLFTSVNGVKWFLERLGFLGKDVRDLKGLKIGAIGPKTAGAWLGFGIKPDLVPQEYRAEAIVECFKKWKMEGQKILLPRAAKAREILPHELRKMGAHVDVVPAYQTIMPGHDTSHVRKMLENGAIDMVTFTSSSTVTNFLEMFGAEGQKLKAWMKNVTIACIGPITADTARKKGLSVNIVPPHYTIESLTTRIVEFFLEETTP
jgi:uroporphyrinogen III methyltransferase/synthase